MSQRKSTLYAGLLNNQAKVTRERRIWALIYLLYILILLYNRLLYKRFLLYLKCFRSSLLLHFCDNSGSDKSGKFGMTYTVCASPLFRPCPAHCCGSRLSRWWWSFPRQHSSQRPHVSRQIGHGRSARRHEECVRFSSQILYCSRVTENGPFWESK